MVYGVSCCFARSSFTSVFGYLQIPAIPDARRTLAPIHAGEKQRELPAHCCGSDDVVVPPWCQTVSWALREKPPDIRSSRTRNTPCLTSLNNKLIDQTALEA